MSARQGVAPARSKESKALRYVARQPILDRDEEVFGYELLFRDGLENAFSGDCDEGSRATVDRSLLMVLDVLCNGRRVFLNCARDTLIKGLVTLFPPFSTAVEILENVPAGSRCDGGLPKLERGRVPDRSRRLGRMLPGRRWRKSRTSSR